MCFARLSYEEGGQGVSWRKGEWYFLFLEKRENDIYSWRKGETAFLEKRESIFLFLEKREIPPYS